MAEEHPPELERIVTGPLAKQIDQFSARRYACSDRGYHRVSKEPPKTETNDLMICYDCELFFGSKDDFVTYRVEPH